MDIQSKPSDPVELAAWQMMVDSQVAMIMADASWQNHKAREMTPIERVVYFALLSRSVWENFKVYPQMPIGRYRADFLVIKERYPDKYRYVIECDGHDFHERTKEQAQHDKKRDRDMQKVGYKVFRFTGSEIWRTTGKCVLEALDALPVA